MPAIHVIQLDFQLYRPTVYCYKLKLKQTITVRLSYLSSWKVIEVMTGHL